MYVRVVGTWQCVWECDKQSVFAADLPNFARRESEFLIIIVIIIITILKNSAYYVRVPKNIDPKCVFSEFRVIRKCPADFAVAAAGAIFLFTMSFTSNSIRIIPERKAKTRRRRITTIYSAVPLNLVPVLVLLTVLLCRLTGTVDGFNVQKTPTSVFSGPEDSLFGFSVALHKENRQGW